MMRSNIKRHQRGQAMAEYVIVCTALILVLVVDIATGKSALMQLIEAFQESYQNFSYIISLPM